MEGVEEKSITKTDEKTWKNAQVFEKNTWVAINQRNGILRILYKFFKALKDPRLFIKYVKFGDFYCGDDWNYWWMDKFENYKYLPKQINNSLEVGSGPYTNTRLISKVVKIREIHCVDPLMQEYRNFKNTYISEMNKKNKIHTYVGKGEKLEFPDEHFDLVICINVLDHVEDAEKCLSEIHRVLKKGGHFVFGQDLKDLGNSFGYEEIDEGHPIILHHKTLDTVLNPAYTTVFKRLLSQSETRVKNHYSVYTFIGKKII
jgi:ubiquinone/menaquinone biosynthesis C-methylase UbiE